MWKELKACLFIPFSSHQCQKVGGALELLLGFQFWVLTTGIIAGPSFGVQCICTLARTASTRLWWKPKPQLLQDDIIGLSVPL